MTDDERGMAWWNRISERDRAFWLDVAGSARPVDAWRMYRFLVLDSKRDG